MSRSGVISTIDTLLSGVTSPTFAAVYQGEPLSIPTTPVAAFWLEAHNELFTTFGDSSTTATFTIQCYWRMQSSPDVRETIEAEVWDAIVNIKTALRGDSNLSGNCTDSNPLDAEVSYEEIGGIVYRLATIPLEVEIYGESVITP
tara:strand:+ start:5503 stop:5937 length:435 start_codon:yes stop_codon:yes gene_type:complete